MATIRKRNGKYQVQVRINGYTKSKTFPCYELAKKWANKQEVIAFTEPDDRPRYQPTNFREILLKYWEYAQHHHKGASVEQIVIQALCREHWVNKPLPGVCRADIIEFRNRRLLSVKPDTFKRQMNIIRSAARMTSDEWGWEVLMLTANNRLPVWDIKHVANDDQIVFSIDHLDMFRGRTTHQSFSFGKLVSAQYRKMKRKITLGL